MSFIDFIEKLRKKPRFVRVQIMWVTVAVCMIVIFSVWLWSLNSDLKNLGNQPAPKNSFFGSLAQIGSDVPSLWQSLGAGIGNVFNSAKDFLKNDPVEITPAPSIMPTGIRENSAAPEETLPIE